MFGIIFTDNKDLRRLLTDYGFLGFPLLKNFPLSGYLEIFYNDAQHTILRSKVKLAQEYRIFHLSYPTI